MPGERAVERFGFSDFTPHDGDRVWRCEACRLPYHRRDAMSTLRSESYQPPAASARGAENEETHAEGFSVILLFVPCNPGVR